MNDLVIRAERPADYRKTEAMVRRSFWNIHGPGCNEHLLVRIIRDCGDYLPELSRVAELDGQIVGAIFYTKARVVDGDLESEIAAFGPLAVEPTLQNLGIGKRLLDETLPLAKMAGYPGLCIYGEPKYYPKRGFMTCDRFGITNPEGKNFDALMAYPLDDEAFSHIHGKLYESAAFEACEDESALNEIEKEFPPYRKIKIQEGFLQLYGRQFATVQRAADGEYALSFWEQSLSAALSPDFFRQSTHAPRTGDTVLFSFGPANRAVIESVIAPY